jgi:putative DNA primase/helicase
MAAEALMETYGERHPEELARLEGIRLAIASEIPEGRRWNDQRLKLLTGEKIPARDMYGKSFVIDPTQKLVIYGNFLPGFRAVNEAIRGRIRILPHPVMIRGTPQEIKGLRELLIDEYPYILRWFIDGAVRWFKRGRLVVPACVLETSTNYLNSVDELGGYLKARTKDWPPMIRTCRKRMTDHRIRQNFLSLFRILITGVRQTLAEARLSSSIPLD